MFKKGDKIVSNTSNGILEKYNVYTIREKYHYADRKIDGVGLEEINRLIFDINVFMTLSEFRKMKLKNINDRIK